MGQKQKTSKGDINISNEKGRIRLRWRFEKIRYSLNLPFPFTQHNMELAKIKAAEIMLDIFNNNFDPTLERYQVKVEASLNNPKKRTSNPDSNQVLQLFEDWVKNYVNGDLENNANYYGTLAMMRRWGSFKLQDASLLLSKENISPTTFNVRKGCLNRFYDWLILKQYLKLNPFNGIGNRRKVRPPNLRRNPLNIDQINLFLNAIKNDTFCPITSAYKHSHYYPFLYFMFRTGVRNEEAIGLRVTNVDLIRNTVRICEVMARTNKGSSNSARVRKNTKTGKERFLPISDDLSKILSPLVERRDPDELVFLSPKAKCIDDKMLQRRILKPVMIKLGLGDKDLYVARHSFGSRAIEQGISPVVTAQFMGNNVETLVKSYAKIINMPKDLPSM